MTIYAARSLGGSQVQAQLQETLRLRLKDSRDGVAMLLLVAMNHRLQTRMARQGIFALDSYSHTPTYVSMQCARGGIV